MSSVAHERQGRLQPSVAQIAKWAFAVGMLVLIFIGAGFFLAGQKFSESFQAVAAIGGAIAGGLIAWLVGRPSSDN
jgi:membrane associated rhomboid family serine protease